MSGTSNTGQPPPQPKRHADLMHQLHSLPPNIQRRIYQLTDPLTQFLHGLTNPSRLTDKHISLLWAECFFNDAVRLVRILPRRKLSWELLLINSRNMRKAVKSIPEFSGVMKSGITGMDLNNGSAVQQKSEVIHSITLANFLSRRSSYQVFCTLLKGKAFDSNPFAVFVASAGIGRRDTVLKMLKLKEIGQEEINAGIDLAAAFGHDKILVDLIPLSPSHMPSIHTAAISGNLYAVQRICRWFPEAFETCPLKECLQRECNDVLVWLLENTQLTGHIMIDDIQRECVNKRNVPMLHYSRDCLIGDFLESRSDYSMEQIAWIQEHVDDLQWPASMMDNAARSGDLALVKLLHEHRGTRCTTAAMDQAAANGHLEIVKFLHQNRKEGCTLRAVVEAIKRNSVSLLRTALWGLGKIALPIEICIAAAKEFGVAIIQLLYLHDPTLDWKKVAAEAENAGNSAVAAWILRQQS
eukprot:jgi/Hompol1/2103/HPOL_005839-RA